MQFDDKVYQEFLKEMQALDSFRVEHGTFYQGTPLEQLEDPDTKRLIEALAFFSARTKIQGERTINATHERIFQQYFPYLLSALPTMGLVEFAPNLRCVDQEVIPNATELVFEMPGSSPVYFMTLRKTQVWPIFYEKLHLEPQTGGKSRLHLYFSALHSNLIPIDSIVLFVNHLGNFLPSIHALYALLVGADSTRVTYDGDIDRSQPARLQQSLADPVAPFFHPVEQIRSQMHLPSQELFLKVTFPPATRKWKSLVITFELGRLWSKGIELTKESFVFNVAPVANLKQATADPIIDEGLKENYPVLYSNPAPRLELHSIKQVYQINSTKTEPLFPALLGVKGNTYDIDCISQTISLDIEGAIQNPKTVVVDGLWMQPWFSEKTNSELKVAFLGFSYPGIEPRILGNLSPGQPPFIEKDPSLLLKLLALKNQSHLSLNEILLLCNAIKELHHSNFSSIVEAISSCEVHQQIDQLGVALSIEYVFELSALEERSLLLAMVFFRYVHRFLNCWLSNFHVQTKLNIANHLRPIVYVGDSYHEFNLLARDIFLHPRN